MIEDSDLQEAYRRVIADGRERLGEPPTPEMVEDLLNGRLSEEEAARVRTLLAYYPELARVMIEPAPAEDVKVLTDAERAADLESIRKRIALPSRPRRRISPALAVAAALLVVVAAAAFIYFQTKRSGPRRNEPVHIAPSSPIDLWPDSASRGAEPSTSATLHASAEPFTLRLLTNDERHYDSYRVDLATAGGTERVLWTRASLTESPGGSFDITVPNGVLQAGRYRFVLYGIRGANAERIASYTVVVLDQ